MWTIIVGITLALLVVLVSNANEVSIIIGTLLFIASLVIFTISGHIECEQLLTDAPPVVSELFTINKNTIGYDAKCNNFVFLGKDDKQITYPIDLCIFESDTSHIRKEIKTAETSSYWNMDWKLRRTQIYIPDTATIKPMTTKFQFKRTP